jgi:predicted MFS family arabinose efflux permease
MNPPASAAYASYVVLLLFLTNVANYGQRMIVAILSPAIKADIGLTDAQLGILMGGGFALVYAIAGVPLARFADRHGRVRWLSIALLLWSLATAAFGWTRSFAQLLLARAGLAAAQSIGIPVSHSIITDYVSAEHRPFALGLHSTGGVLGATLAAMLGGYCEAHIGWRSTTNAIALAGILLAVLIYVTMREPPRGGFAQTAGTSTDFIALRSVVRHVVAVRSYPLILTAISFGTLVEFGLNQWLPSYYVRQFSLSIEDVGWRYGLTVAAGGIPGSIIGGMLATSLARRDVRWLAWLPALMYVIAIPLGLTMLLASSAATAMLLNGLYSCAIFATNGPLWAACFRDVPPMMRATTSALTLLVSGVTGLALGPTLVGLVSDALAVHAGAQSLQVALLGLETLAVGVVIPLLFAAGRLRRDDLDADSPLLAQGRDPSLARRLKGSL